jgi:hypothetical protein
LLISGDSWPTTTCRSVSFTAPLSLAGQLSFALVLFVKALAIDLSRRDAVNKFVRSEQRQNFSLDLLVGRWTRGHALASFAHSGQVYQRSEQLAHESLSATIAGDTQIPRFAILILRNSNRTKSLY